MRSRRLCTECHEISHPDTVLDGSDRMELVGWLLLAVPGLVYCWWRHAAPSWTCVHCGSEALVRASKRSKDAPPMRPRVRSRRGEIEWPQALATPRERMLHGGAGAALFIATLMASWLAAMARVSIGQSLGLSLMFAASWSLWLGYEVVRVVRSKARGTGCRAWDGDGRSLRIETI